MKFNVKSSNTIKFSFIFHIQLRVLIIFLFKYKIKAQQTEPKGPKTSHYQKGVAISAIKQLTLSCPSKLSEHLFALGSQ